MGAGADDGQQMAGRRVVLRRGRLVDGSLVDIHIADGAIVEAVSAGSLPTDSPPPAAPAGASEAFGDGDTTSPWPDAEVHDLDGWLVLPAMAEPHAHLDKALTADLVPNPTGDLLGAIDAWNTASEAGALTYDDTVERAARALELLLVNGVTAVRTHVNVSAAIGATKVRAVREAARRYSGLVDVQIVALTGVPTTGPEGAGTRKALADALAEGVDLVGGCPHLDPDGPALIAQALDAAEEAGIGVDLHSDEQLDPSVLTVRDLAYQVEARGFPHRVAASHCVSLGMLDPAAQAVVAAELAKAGVAVIPLPQTNLFLQGRDHSTATPRGLTAVQALLDAGVLVAAGGDNVQDPFNLVGRSDGLETAALMVMAGHRLPAEAYHLVSNAPRAVMGLAPVSFAPGDPADLVVIDAPSLRGAIADAPRSRRVFRRGVLVASCDESARVHHRPDTGAGSRGEPVVAAATETMQLAMPPVRPELRSD